MKRWEYTEDEIFDVAYVLMNDYPEETEGYEAADLQDELMYAEDAIIGDLPFLFTMVEDEDDDNEDLVVL